MAKLLLVGLAWFVVAMVAPELRPLLVVGSFCFLGGFMVGMQRKAKHDAELVTARMVRGAQSWQAE